jgi:hypothetical protein
VGERSTLEVTVHGDVTAVEEIDRHTGFAKAIPLKDDGTFLITLPGGTGSLLRITREGQAPPPGE